jgi:enamine deaminase RidA (YjgF/YER057c/UK114 family)
VFQVPVQVHPRAHGIGLQANGLEHVQQHIRVVDRVIRSALGGGAGTDLSQLVRVNYYTTDVDALSAALPLVIPRLGTAECRPASTLLGIVRLALPEMLIEIEATALLP